MKQNPKKNASKRKKRKSRRSSSKKKMDLLEDLWGESQAPNQENEELFNKKFGKNQKRENEEHPQIVGNCESNNKRRRRIRQNEPFPLSSERTIEASRAELHGRFLFGFDAEFVEKAQKNPQRRRGRRENAANRIRVGGRISVKRRVTADRN